jgi:hypothetical protein
MIELRRENERLRAVAGILKPTLSATERQFYRRHLVEGGPEDRTDGRQGRLAAAMRVAETQPLARVWLDELAARSADDVAVRLRRIIAAESVLAPAAALFGYLLTRDDHAVKHVSRDVAARWNGAVRSVAEDAAQVLGEFGTGEGSWSEIAVLLQDGDYARLMTALLARNRDVMDQRNGAPWAVVGENGRIVVRFRDEPTDLLDAEELPFLWRNPYFLPSLHYVQQEINER